MKEKTIYKGKFKEIQTDRIIELIIYEDEFGCRISVNGIVKYEKIREEK